MIPMRRTRCAHQSATDFLTTCRTRASSIPNTTRKCCFAVGAPRSSGFGIPPTGAPGETVATQEHRKATTGPRRAPPHRRRVRADPAKPRPGEMTRHRRFRRHGCAGGNDVFHNTFGNAFLRQESLVFVDTLPEILTVLAPNMRTLPDGVIALPVIIPCISGGRSVG
jgi:hypothetical protein